MSNSSDTMKRAAEMLGCEEDEVIERLEKLPVDGVIDALDAVQAGHLDRLKELLGDDVDENDHTHDEDEGDDEPEINPLFMKNAQKNRKTSNHPVEEKSRPAHTPNVGDSVLIDGDEGIVKLKHGPNDTTGVIIDGETTMVDSRKIRPSEGIREGVIGASNMPDLRRMRELAGLAPSTLGLGAVDLTHRMNAPEGPLAPGGFDVDVTPCPEPTCDGNVAGVVPAAEPSVEVVVDVAACEDTGDLAAVLGAFDEIEEILPGITLGDVKLVRERINALLSRLNESTDGRARKA